MQTTRPDLAALVDGLGHGRAPAWRSGFVAGLAGLGDPCPHRQTSVDAIEWTDGQAEALRALRELPLEG